MKPRIAVGMDFGGTNARVALVSSKARVIDKLLCDSREVKSPDLFIPRAVQMIRQLLDKNDLKISQIAGIGLGVPGSVDPVKGLVHFLPNLPYWKNVQLTKALSGQLKTRVRLDNDATAMAQGEFLFGAARGSSHAVFLTLGTGVGGGILVDGKLFHGKRFSACEIGHIRHGGGRKRCACGSRGCIETEIGNSYLLSRAKKDLRRKTPPVLKKLIARESDRKLKLELITQAARRGDRYSIQFWKTAGETLGDFVGGICNLLNPEVVVIGGGIVGAGKFLLDPLKSAFKANSFPLASKGVRVVTAQFGKNAGLIGAASLILAGDQK